MDRPARSRFQMSAEAQPHRLQVAGTDDVEISYASSDAPAALVATWRILSARRHEADRYSRSGGGRLTASLRLAEEGLIGEPDAVLERGRGAPAELGQPADVEQL